MTSLEGWGSTIELRPQCDLDDTVLWALTRNERAVPARV